MRNVYLYTVYLKTFDWSKTIGVGCDNLEEVEIVLENAEEEYFFYMVIKRDPSIGDYVYERGQLQRDINKVKTLSKQNKNRKR